MKKLVVSPRIAQIQTIADQRQQRDLALARDHPAGDHDGLARRDEPDEGARLEEGHHPDQRVSPGPERLGDVLDHLLRVGQLGEDAARVDRQADAITTSGLRSSCDSRSASATPERRDSDARPRRPARDVIWPAGTRAGRRSAQRRGSAGRSGLTIAPAMPRPLLGRGSVGNTPKLVGPEPLTRAASAPASRSCGERPGELGAERERGPLEVVLERRRRARSGRPRRARAAVGVEPLAARRRAGRARA